MELKRRVSFRKYITIFYIAAFFMYLVLGLQPAEATHYVISGELRIPKIGLVSDVTTLELINHRLATPDTIVGSYSRYDSKIFLIGHSSTVFKNLDQIQIDDTINYNNKEYIVKQTEILAKDVVDMKEIVGAEEKNTLIIMTCAGESIGEHDASHRLVVTATEV